MRKADTVLAILLAGGLFANMVLVPLAPSFAQAAPIPTYVTAEVFKPNQTAVFRTFTWLWEPEIYCNLVPRVPLTGIVYNPSTIEFPDPVDGEKACRINWEPFLASLPPLSGYRLNVGYLFADGTRSDRSPLSGQFRRGPIGSLCVDRGGAEVVGSRSVGGESIRLWACAEAQ